MDTSNYLYEGTTVLPPYSLLANELGGARSSHKDRAAAEPDWRDLAIRLTMENDALVAENAALKAHIALLTAKPVEPTTGEVLARALAADSYWSHG